ncbi:MAG: nucleotidyltransferase family protein, partial [Clostridia bacterium]|nr:nucleotidyltransferase family protein [Clostridia bacterium]
MTSEKVFFIRILSDHLAGKESEAPQGDFDWAALAKLSYAHQLEGVVYAQCRKFIPAEYINRFERGYAAATFFYGNRIKEVELIGNALRDAGIEFYTVKGLDTAKYYPVPALRTMGDSDFVVSDLPRAIKIMRDLGFVGSSDEDVDEWACDKNSMHFEIHSVLVKFYECATKKQHEFFRGYISHA